MIVQAGIFRVKDGLPLSASTDMDQRPEVKGCQKYIKMLSRRLDQLPDRCTLNLDGFYIHLISTMTMTFLVLVEDSCPAVLAFCFLYEIEKQFLLKYEASSVQNVKRPYAFIEFDTTLQKTKQRFNSPRSLTTRVNLGDMSTELKLRPSYSIKEEDLGIVNLSNGVVVRDHTESFRPTVGPSRRLVPLTWVGWIAVILDVLCVILNIARGMAFISHGYIDDEDSGAYRYGGTFLFAACVHTYQIYMLFYYSRNRTLKIATTLFGLCWCIYYLEHFRNWLQVGFHVTVVWFSSICIFKRKLTQKLPGYSV